MRTHITCFLIEPAPLAVEALERGSDLPCAHDSSPNKTHFASQIIEDQTTFMVDAWGASLLPSDELKQDPRWPVRCLCGYPFQPSDRWVHRYTRLFKKVDEDHLLLLAQAPAGAMWFADWYPDAWKGPDGRTLVVRTPGGDWIIDGPSWNNGVETHPKPWTRAGRPPIITVIPSINQPTYHGWLRCGVLEEAL